MSVSLAVVNASCVPSGDQLGGAWFEASWETTLEPLPSALAIETAKPEE
jgi:hypothetical protein